MHVLILLLFGNGSGISLVPCHLSCNAGQLSRVDGFAEVLRQDPLPSTWAIRPYLYNSRVVWIRRGAPTEFPLPGTWATYLHIHLIG